MHTHTLTHAHQHTRCISERKGWLCPEGWKDYYGPESEAGRDEPLNLWEREQPNKHSQSNKPDSCCLQLNKLSFYRSSLMGSKWSLFFISLSHYCILCTSIADNLEGKKTCCSGILCFMTVCSNNSLKILCRWLTVFHLGAGFSSLFAPYTVGGTRIRKKKMYTQK